MSRTACFLATIALFATLAATTSYVAAATETAQAPALESLSAACKKAKADFRPIDQSDVQQAKNLLIEALDKLDQRLAQAGDNGQAWRGFLEVAALREHLSRDAEPDKNLLGRIRARYNSGHDGLELVWFLDVQTALHNYLAMNAAVDNPKVRAEFEKQMDRLAASLETYATKPTTEDALVISESVRWLQQAKQAPALVEAIQSRFVQPNLLAEISPAVLGAGIAEPVDDTTPVRDCILGTSIYGTAHTVGQTSVALVPDPNFGVLDAIFFGTTESDNVGYHGPVTIYSSATTNLAARKRIWIHPEGLSSYPGVSSATTAVAICDIQSNKGRQFIERMAWKRSAKQQGTAECIASRHAEQKLNERIDQQAAEALDRANRDYVEKFYRPFNERKLFPQKLQFSTTEQAVRLVGLQAGGGKLAAPGAPLSVAEGADLSLRIHESMINNLAFDALAGRTVYEEKLQQAAIDALGRLPDEMKGDDDGKPWAITFAPRQPISVTFADDGLKITLRGVRYMRGAEAHPAMNVSASYKIEKSQRGFKAVRQGEIQVFPPDFVPGTQIDARRQVIRTLLEKRFEKVFKPELLGEGFELSGKWKAAGKLLPIQVECRDGWLVIAWKRAAAEPQVAATQKQPATAN